ncbi:MAG: TlyA family RNA methyltransferase [Spirochaetia bacterium]|nr:TlyA family RNA methyltransferase [Spirochaetia bacterium]
MDTKHAIGLILSSNVLINDEPVTSTAHKVKKDDVVRIRNQKKWIARSGEKLDFALKSFQYNIEDKVCVDVGASTGGFTQVLLKHGARLVYAVDVAYGFLHPVLRNNPAVYVLERTHICNVSKEIFFEKPDMFVVDVSFISIQKICICLKKLFNKWEGIVLFKPQFEASAIHLTKGILTDPIVLDKLLFDFKVFLQNNDIEILNEIESPIHGKKGNREFLFYIKWE